MNKRVFSFTGIMIIMSMFFMINFSPVIYAGAVASMPDANRLQDLSKKFIDTGKSNAKIKENQVGDILKPLAAILLGLGTVILVIVTAIMGIKYMVATPEERGKLKTQLIGIAVSATVLFGAYGIWKIAYTIMEGLTK